MEQLFTALANFGILGYVAWLYFKNNEEFKKHHQDLTDRQSKHQEAFIAVIENNTKVMTSNVEVLTYTKAVHVEMDDKLTAAIKSVEDLKTEVRDGRTKDKEITERILKELESIQRQLLQSFKE